MVVAREKSNARASNSSGRRREREREEKNQRAGEEMEEGVDKKLILLMIFHLSLSPAHVSSQAKAQKAFFFLLLFLPPILFATHHT